MKRQPECMDMKWKSRVDRKECELTGTKSARAFRQLENIWSLQIKFGLYENLD